MSLLANPRGFCAGVDRAIAIVEQALAQFGAPIYVRHEVVHNRFVVDDLKAKGAVFVEELDEVPPGSTVVFSAHGVSEAGARRGRGARAAGVRRDVPARHQGPRRSGADARARARDRDDRPRRPPGGRRARWDSATAASISSSRWPTSSGSRSRDPDNLAYVTQTTLSVDDAAAIVEALKRRFPRDRRAEEGRHLLRDAEPAGRRQVDGAAGRRRDRRRQPQQLELQPAARGRRESRHSRVHGRPRRRARRAWIDGQDARRRHRRRVGARSARARGDRRLQVARRRAACASSTARRSGSCFRCRRACRPAHASAAEEADRRVSARLRNERSSATKARDAQRRGSAGDQRMPPRLGHARARSPRQNRTAAAATRSAARASRPRATPGHRARAAAPSARATSRRAAAARAPFPRGPAGARARRSARGDALPASVDGAWQARSLRLPAGAVSRPPRSRTARSPGPARRASAARQSRCRCRA